MSAESEQMSCQEFVELVTDYPLEGIGCSPDGLARSASHLEQCRRLLPANVQQMRETVKALRGLVPGEISSETRARILAAFPSAAAR